MDAYLEPPFITEGGVIYQAEEPEATGPAVVVCSYDPGHTTGWSGWRVPLSVLSVQGTQRSLARAHWAMGQIVPTKEAWRQGLWVSNTVDQMLEVGRWVYSELVDEAAGDVFAFVYEGFRLRYFDTDPALLAPVEVGAVLRDRLRDVKVPLYMQLSSGPLTTVTDERLRRWCVYRRDSGEHARDAQRHGIFFLRRIASEPLLRAELGL